MRSEDYCIIIIIYFVCTVDVLVGLYVTLLTLGAHAQRGLQTYSSCLVCVCVCVCLSAPFRPLRVKVSPENDTNASSRQDKENKTGDFLKNAPFKSYGIICSLCRRSAVL